MNRIIKSLLLQILFVSSAFLVLTSLPPSAKANACHSVDRIISLAENQGALVRVIEGNALLRAKVIYATVPSETEISTATRGMIIIPRQGARLLVLLDQDGGAGSCSTLSIPQNILHGFIDHVLGERS